MSTKISLPIALISLGLFATSIGCGGGTDDDALKPRVEEEVKKAQQAPKQPVYTAEDYREPSRKLQHPVAPTIGVLPENVRKLYNRYVAGEQLNPNDLQTMKLSAEKAIGESVGTLLFIERATVGMSLPPLSRPEDSDDDTDPLRSRAEATVWVELSPGTFTLNSEQKASIAMMVASNFPHLDARNINILGTGGKAYKYGGEDPSAAVAPDKVKRDAERAIKSKAELLLSPYQAKAEASVSVALHGGVGRLIHEETRAKERGAQSSAPAKTEKPVSRGESITEKETLSKYALVFEPVMEDSTLAVTIPSTFVLSDARIRDLKEILHNATGVPLNNIVIGQLTVEKIDAGKRVGADGSNVENAD